ncbi:MAG: RiPP maturation radical SAM C-methyltransferase [Desulfobulbaceae bacterium]|nr:RiPP maturation radical SAM C-methyltransferase [Desulfobulbaceae bacterium]
MRILLASMPWAIFNRPSIQLSSLQAYIRQHGGETSAVETSHPYLTAAGEIGLENYRIISENTWAAEALYCALLFPDRYDKARHVYQQSLNRKTARALPDFDLLAEQLDVHLNNWLARLQPEKYSLAGFTVCFSQLPASLLAVRRMKKKFPGLPVVLGGSTCTPRIGSSLLDAFPEIDFVINGEGEKPLFRLIQYLAGAKEHPGQDVQYLEAVKQKKIRPEPHLPNDEIRDLNSLPIPDYTDYFAELHRTGLSFIPVLPLEFSRGCWWNKCTFCNLNLQWCGYRAKNSGRVQQEVELIAAKYRSLDFVFTDNSLPPKEAGRFFSAITGSKKDLRFFGEIRAPVTPESCALYYAGGLRSIQAGIEAFSNSLLERMNKGTRVIDNIAVMKFSLEAGIKLDGNLILEFPGSTEKEVDETCRVLNYVLPYRPLKAAAFFLGHGSPVWQNPRQYGLHAVTRHHYNRQLYPEQLLAKMEMIIQSYRGGRKHQQTIWQPVREKIRHWQDFHAARKDDRPALTYRDGRGFIIVRQECPGGEKLHHRLHGLSRKIYLACREPVALQKLGTDFNSIGEKQLLAFLEDLKRKRLLFQDEDLCLALAVKEQ